MSTSNLNFLDFEGRLEIEGVDFFFNRALSYLRFALIAWAPPFFRVFVAYWTYWKKR